MTYDLKRFNVVGDGLKCIRGLFGLLMTYCSLKI